jgi:hypothetical protein
VRGESMRGRERKELSCGFPRVPLWLCHNIGKQQWSTDSDENRFETINVAMVSIVNELEYHAFRDVLSQQVLPANHYLMFDPQDWRMGGPTCVSQNQHLLTHTSWTSSLSTKSFANLLNHPSCEARTSLWHRGWLAGVLRPQHYTLGNILSHDTTATL